jgi:transcriptional regulator with XRE-family HTH domain
VLGLKSRSAVVGRNRWRELAQRNGRELLTARVTAGMTQRQVARRADVTQSTVSAAEAGDPKVSFDIRCRLAAACGHEVSLRLFPIATVPLRDSGQLTLATAIAAESSPVWLARLEVPTGPGAHQAADLLLEGPDEVLDIEIERGFADVQAQLRAAGLKRASLSERESRPVRLVIAVPDTRTARERLAPHAELIERAFPAPSRHIWRAIRHGTPCGGDGILYVRARLAEAQRGPISSPAIYARRNRAPSDA